MRALLSLVAGFQNPHLLLLDRAGFARRPYTAISRNGLKIAIRPQTGDRFTAFETFAMGTYNRALKKVAAGDCVVDVGANIGCFAMAAAQIVGRTGSVIALEPERKTFAILERNIGANGLKQIRATNVAVGSSERICEITAPAENALFTSMFSQVDGRPIVGERQTIACSTLETVLAASGRRKVALLKLDCEGAEHEIIAALTPAVASAIDAIVIEFHTIPGHSVDESIEHLKTLGYAYEPGHTHLFWRSNAPAVVNLRVAGGRDRATA